MSRSIRGRRFTRRKNISLYTYHEIDWAKYVLARQPRPPFGDGGGCQRQGEDHYYWKKAHHAVFRGGGFGHHSDYHQCYMRWKIRKQWRASEKQKAYREVRDHFSLDEKENASIVGEKSMESHVAEYLVIEVEDGYDGLAHLCEAESWEAAVELARTEGRLSTPEFRQGDPTVTLGMARLCVNEIRDMIGVIVPDETMLEMISSDRHLRQQLTAFYRDVDASGLDTFERELVGEAFAQHLGSNEGWPTNGSSEKEHEFFLDLVRVAVKEGQFQLTPESPIA